MGTAARFPDMTSRALLDGVRTLLELGVAILMLTGALALGTASCSGGKSGSSGSSGDDVCSREALFAGECGVTDPCQTALINACVDLLPLYSAGYVSALDSCFQRPFACADGGSTTPSACLATKMSQIVPSVAAQKLQADFCFVCPDGASKSAPTGCSSFFAPRGPGASTLAYADSVLSRVGQACAGAAADAGAGGDCAARFTACATSAIGQAVPPPPACRADAGP